MSAPLGPIAALYVPGSRTDRFAKALASAADAVVIDLEDAVSARDKETARAAAARFVARLVVGKPLHVRINGLTSPWWKDDLAALADAAGLAAVRVPKVETPGDVVAVAERLGDGVGLYCFIESALGLEAAFDIARAHPAVAGIGLGEADLSGDLGVRNESGLAWARSRIVVAARAAGLPAPAMSVYTDLGDDDGLYASCLAGRELGFVGRTVIHPKQIPTILRAFTPDAAEVEAASRVLTALAGAEILDGGTAVLSDGRFVDRAMAQSAERVLALREAVRRCSAGDEGRGGGGMSAPDAHREHDGPGGPASHDSDDRHTGRAT